MRLFYFLLVCFLSIWILEACSKSKTLGVSSSELAPSAVAETDSTKPAEKSMYDVLTEKVKTDPGLFPIHRVADKWYFEIPDSLLGRDMLWVTRIAGCPPNLSPYLNAGSKTNEQMIRWEQKGNQILLKSISLNAVADEADPIYQSVQFNNFQPILQAFKIEHARTDSTGWLVEVTDLFEKDVPAFSGLSSGYRKRYGVKGLDKSRSYIDTLKAFPHNIEVRHVQTYKASKPPENARSQSISLLMNQSMILLPADPMMPRMYDPRVGWFTVQQIDYSSEALKADKKTYLKRWRLVPKDPEAYAKGELVEPVKPIVFYLDPATPERWRPWFKKGIEDWQATFETAGFKNAIIARDPPSPEEDPEFSPEDVRYSVVRYVASETRNAMGPSVADPRTGEILESDVIWYHNHIRSYRNRYLLETGGANPLAQTLETPDEAIGDMIRQVIAHEVGHSLGLPHNMRASYAYPVDSLRSASFTQENGVAATIMDYARYNYVAQPGDQGVRFVRKIGPYDHYSINWGYRYIPDIKSPKQEKPTLHSWITERADNPVYRFGSGRGRFDPASQTECIGDDAIKASTYGMRNLQRVAPKLVDWTTNAGEDYSDLEELYGELLGVWRRYVGHVITYVGGSYQYLKTADEEGAVYEPVPLKKQEAAMEWLLANAFSTPDWLMREDIFKRIGYDNGVERIRKLQSRLLNSLLNDDRLLRLAEAERETVPTYELWTMMDDLRLGIWSELYAGKTIPITRRNLQRAWVEQLGSLLEQEELSQSDIPAAARAQLQKLKQDISRRIGRMNEDKQRYHFEDILFRIESIMDPER